MQDLHDAGRREADQAQAWSCIVDADMELAERRKICIRSNVHGAIARPTHPEAQRNWLCREGNYRTYVWALRV